MEETSTPVLAPKTTSLVSGENPALVVRSLPPVFKYPTPSLEYLADTKQSDIYKSVGMDRGRKNLLINSLYRVSPSPPLDVVTAKLTGWGGWGVDD